MKIDQLVHNLFYPTCNSPSMTTEIKKIIYHRNRAFCIIFSVLIAFFLMLKYCVPSIPQGVCNLFMFALALMDLIVLLTGRRFPGFFGFCYMWIAIVFGPICFFYIEDGFYYSYCCVLAVPSFVMVISERWYYTLFTLVSELYFLFHYIAPGMIEILVKKKPEETVVSLHGAGFVFALLIPAILLINDFKQARYRELMEEAKQLEYAYNKQNSFLLGLSHELRNPLNSMLGNIQLALFEDLSPKVRGVLEDTQLCGDILLHLINNILDSGKASIGKLEVNPAVTNVYTVCERIWGISSRLIAHKGLYGTLRIDKRVPPYLQLDSYRLTQVLLNLVGNSVKFTMNGEIRVDVEWISDKTIVDNSCFEPIPYDDEEEGIYEKKQKSMSYLEDIRYSVLTLKCKNFNDRMKSLNDDQYRDERGVLKISVKDTGCGMKEKDLTQLFQQFVQVNTDSLTHWYRI